MGLEQTSWEWFRGHAQKIEGLGLQRVENMLQKGIPDVFGHLETTSFWIENKACDRPVRPTSLLRFDIYQEQIIWLEHWWKRGCQCYALVRVGQGTAARVYLIKGCDAGHLEKCRESELKDLSVLNTNRSVPAAIVCKILDRGQHQKIN
ncbi:MAG: hypothetical protein V3W44_09845 [Dehalococcoidales bacterium]